jgi:hypothetical protein
MLSPEQSAFAALAAGDLVRANLLERRAESIWSESWAPYLTLKAMRLLESGEDAAARAALGQTHRAFRARIPWRSAAELAHIREAATPGLLPPARTTWEAADWWFDRGASRLDLLPAHPAATLVLEPGTALAKSALVEVLWDGTRLPLVEVPAGGESATTFRIELNSPGATPEAHLLEIRPLSGDLRPAMRVRLD